MANYVSWAMQGSDGWEKKYTYVGLWVGKNLSFGQKVTYVGKIKTVLLGTLLVWER